MPCSREPSIQAQHHAAIVCGTHCITPSFLHHPLLNGDRFLDANQPERWISYIDGRQPSRHRCLWTLRLETQMQVQASCRSRRCPPRCETCDRHERTLRVDLSHHRFKRLSCRPTAPRRSCEGSAKVLRAIERVSRPVLPQPNPKPHGIVLLAAALRIEMARAQRHCRAEAGVAADQLRAAGPRLLCLVWALR